MTLLALVCPCFMLRSTSIQLQFTFFFIVSAALYQ
jgi:hypothetical protein